MTNGLRSQRSVRIGFATRWKSVQIAAAAAACLTTTSTALAHPNHAQVLAPADTAAHYILQPSHFLVPAGLLVAAFVAAMVATRVVANRRTKLAKVRVRS